MTSQGKEWPTLASAPQSFMQILRADFGKNGFAEIIYHILFRPEGLATFLYRASSRLHSKGKLGWAISMLLWRLNILINGCEIEPVAVIGAGLRIVHPNGLVVGRSVIGKNASLFQRVTIGQNPLVDHATPIIGDNVTIYAGAVIAGGIKIGDNCIIGANTVITNDLDEHTLAKSLSSKNVVRE